MNVPNEFVEYHRREIEEEANRLHELRKVFCPEKDTPHDNWVSSCTNVFIRYQSKGNISKPI